MHEPGKIGLYFFVPSISAPTHTHAPPQKVDASSFETPSTKRGDIIAPSGSADRSRAAMADA